MDHHTSYERLLERQESSQVVVNKPITKPNSDIKPDKGELTMRFRMCISAPSVRKHTQTHTHTHTHTHPQSHCCKLRCLRHKHSSYIRLFSDPPCPPTPMSMIRSWAHACRVQPACEMNTRGCKRPCPSSSSTLKLSYQVMS